MIGFAVVGYLVIGTLITAFLIAFTRKSVKEISDVEIEAVLGMVLLWPVLLLFVPYMAAIVIKIIMEKKNGRSDNK